MIDTGRAGSEKLVALPRPRMVTLFATPKPFRGHVEVIQRNAVRSWAMLRPACQIVLLGDDDGTAEMAKECGADHIPEVGRNESGAPLLDSAFAAAERVATGDVLCYVNADIMLMSDFTAAVARVAGGIQRFLMIGQRWNVAIDRRWDFDQPEWEDHLRSYVRGHGALAGPFGGADYFVFSRGLWQTLPPLAIGRFHWDWWLIFRARSLGAPVVDATTCVMAIHQAHDYPHLPGGEADAGCPEGRRNFALAGGPDHLFTVGDTTHILTQRGVAPETARRLKSKRIYYGSRVLVKVGINHYLAGNVRAAWTAWSEAVMRDPFVVSSLVLHMAKYLLGLRMLRWSRRVRDRVMFASHGNDT